MERCSNCGQPNRPGARFCTTCGHKMPAAESGTASEADDVVRDTNATEITDPPIAGWPSSPPASEHDAHAAWAPPELTPSASKTTDTGDLMHAGDPDSHGSLQTERAWPAPPSGSSPTTPDVVDSSSSTLLAADDANNLADQGDDRVAIASAKERAAHLLDELRDAIAALDGQPALDLTPVIADLEVAVTPPGAINPEQLGDLREALLAAREKPRDIDTIVALTGQLDALVALIFAYDRAVAAIERALDALRRD